MNKKHILALLSGTLLLASTVFGDGKKNENVKLEETHHKNENLEKNRFKNQDKSLRETFGSSNDVFDQPDIFYSNLDPDPWDD